MKRSQCTKYWGKLPLTHTIHLSHDNGSPIRKRDSQFYDRFIQIRGSVLNRSKIGGKADAAEAAHEYYYDFRLYLCGDVETCS